ncbi:AbrB/MazE/SpoVT family DNA-binding domain-containing protein [Candidatus Woesearchaeota archaeon]|nr:AbrB/MazE/SpoVT family DNA-binding domain-containing protein [Candidatus Woesearchaeota archaeon]
MLVKRAIGERGQFVVPKDIREQLGLRAGSEVTVEVKGDEMVVKPAKTPQQIVEEFCSSSRRIKIKGDPVKWIKKRLNEQYEEEYGLLRR